MLNQIIEALQTTLSNMVIGITDFIPRFLIGLVLILIGWLIARTARMFLLRVGKRIGIDSIIERIGIGDLLVKIGIESPPSQLIATFFFWMLWLNFLLEGFKAMGMQEAVQPLEGLIDFFPQGIAALLIFVLGFMFATFVGNTVNGATESIGIDFHNTLGNLARFLILSMVLVVVMEQIGLDVQIVTQILTNTILIIILGLAIAFGLGGKSVAQNVLAGFYAREMYGPGDTIVIDGEEGMLEGIGTLNAEMRVGSDRVTVPNTRLTEGTVRRRDS
ncbi:MAG: mechanosensitive ion channel family protein [Candidatus Promineifilaceae bacterium]